MADSLLTQLDELLGVTFFSGGSSDVDVAALGPSKRVLVVNVHRSRGRPDDRGPPTTTAIVFNGAAHIASGQVEPVRFFSIFFSFIHQVLLRVADTVDCYTYRSKAGIRAGSRNTP
jgi:hypothetical protein